VRLENGVPGAVQGVRGKQDGGGHMTSTIGPPRSYQTDHTKWRDVDLNHGRVRLDKNKTDDPRAWALSPDVVRTLVWWKGAVGAEPDDPVIGVDPGDGAWWLRGAEVRESTPDGTRSPSRPSFGH
jgi:hypothetical protein